MRRAAANDTPLRIRFEAKKKNKKLENDSSVNSISSPGKASKTFRGSLITAIYIVLKLKRTRNNE